MKRIHLKSKGFTLVEIMIVVAIIALLAAIAIPNLLRAKMSANDAIAKATLRSESTASEAYAAANSGSYPLDETNLLAPNANPPYLNKSYCGTTASGYSFACTFTATGYTVTANPGNAGTSGTTTYTISTGGVLTP